MHFNSVLGKVVLAAALGMVSLGCEGVITDGDDSFASNGGRNGGNGGNGGSDGNGGADDSVSAPRVTVDFTPSDEDLINPERGYYSGLALIGGNAARVREKGHSLAIALVRLDNYRYADLDAAFLADLEEGFASVRAAGIKVILRFMYNSSFSADASKDRILGHIAQLKPLLQENADVIALMQGGFIGAWGEWHGSTNGLENNTDRRDIMAALLDALPAERTVAIRTPMYKEGAFPGGPLTEEEAYSGSDRARIGHHNDCFLASASDQGTFASPVAEWQSYVSEDGRFTPIGGETCALYEPKTNCEVSVGEMEANRFSYLNSEYRDEVLEGWDAEGCGDEIRRRLGARFALTRVSHSEAVAPGGVFELDFDVVNEGFASAYNERPVYVVLRAGEQVHKARISADPRLWGAGEKTTVSTRLRVPADLPAGDYQVSLWLPDAASSLQRDTRYAIRLANQGVWESATGENVVARALAVDAATGGGVDAAADELVEL